MPTAALHLKHDGSLFQIIGRRVEAVFQGTCGYAQRATCSHSGEFADAGQI